MVRTTQSTICGSQETHECSGDDVSGAVLALRLRHAVAELLAPGVPVPQHGRHQRDQLLGEVGRLRA